MADEVVLYVIYHNPRDIELTSYVVRRFVGERPDFKPWALANSLNEARSSLPTGMVNLGRDENDDPVILEVWI